MVDIFPGVMVFSVVEVFATVEVFDMVVFGIAGGVGIVGLLVKYT